MAPFVQSRSHSALRENVEMQRPIMRWFTSTNTFHLALVDIVPSIVFSILRERTQHSTAQHRLPTAMSDYEPVMPAVQPCASLLSLPTELLLTILTSRSLTLIDLTVLSSTCSTLRPLAHTAASKHRARKVLAECLGFAPGDCLSVECWSDEMIGREMGKCLRPWEVFVPVEELLVEVSASGVGGY